MSHRFSELTFTPAVLKMQQHFGSAERASGVRNRMPSFNRFSQRETEFIQMRDSFYMASVSEDGWPYIQHRGGEKGFLRVVNDSSLVFANYSGNGQYQSLGNLSANNRVALFLMDYPKQRRLKVLGKAEFLNTDNLPKELDRLKSDFLAEQRVESIVQIHLEAFDWNCPQYITPRYSEAELTVLQEIHNEAL
ncbi:MAG: pyridoxamine 5'-phosphate oxidase family protein [Neptuniibacter sp.]